MVKIGDVQRFTMWICGSIAAFGCIATLIAYAMYNNKNVSSCPSTPGSCPNTTSTASETEQKILKLVSPIAIAVGLLSIIGIRCWQQASQERAVQMAAIPALGQSNNGFHEQNFDAGAPPSYNDALGMDVILEAHGSFPSEPPPKYDEIQSSMEEQTRSRDEESGVLLHRDLEPRTSQDSGPAEDGVSVRSEASLPLQNEVVSMDPPDCSDSNLDNSLSNDSDLNNETDHNLNTNQQVGDSTEPPALNTASPVQGTETRIFVQQRDSNLSTNQLEDSNRICVTRQDPVTESNDQGTSIRPGTSSISRERGSNSSIGPLSEELPTDTTSNYLERRLSEAGTSDGQQPPAYSGVFFL